MAAIRSSGTAPEKRLGVLLKLMLPRRKIVQRPALPGRPDYYVPGLRLAVFADGCFWHGCPKHGHIPGDNRHYWLPKLRGNRVKDRRAVRELRRQGIHTVRIWEHELRRSLTAARRKLRRVLLG
jgi:DNA mismatch endonuclease (patch repair protein)